MATVPRKKNAFDRLPPRKQWEAMQDVVAMVWAVCDMRVDKHKAYRIARKLGKQSSQLIYNVTPYRLCLLARHRGTDLSRI